MQGKNYAFISDLFKSVNTKYDDYLLPPLFVSFSKYTHLAGPSAWRAHGGSLAFALPTLYTFIPSTAAAYPLASSANARRLSTTTRGKPTTTVLGPRKQGAASIWLREAAEAQMKRRRRRR